MLSYVHYGNGKVGFVTTEYTISDHYKIKMKMNLSKEVESESTETREVPLTFEERQMVKKFQKGLEQRKRPFLEENEEKFEGTEIRYKGEVIKDEKFEKQLRFLLDLIESNHEELSRERIASMYDQACSKLYKKVG